MVTSLKLKERALLKEVANEVIDSVRLSKTQEVFPLSVTLYDDGDFEVSVDGGNGANAFDVSIESITVDGEDEIMIVKLTNDTGHVQNLTGQPFSVTVTALDDEQIEGVESLTFDIIDSAKEDSHPGADDADGDYGGIGNDYISFEINDDDFDDLDDDPVPED